MNQYKFIYTKELGKVKIGQPDSREVNVLV